MNPDDVTYSANPLIWVFSMVSGETYQIFEDELAKLGTTVVVLKEHAPESCKKCFGRFHVGFNTKLQVYQPCPKCARKVIDFSRLNQKGEIEVKTPKIVDYVDAPVTNEGIHIP
jgi:hypothetical protein